VGARADLVLLAQDPTGEIGAVADPVGVMLRGRWMRRDRLEDLAG
jgi:imidazolonepropionase-like amidohydrolase